MYIDTTAANSRSRQPQIVISPRYDAPYTGSQNPLLDEPLNDRDAPPTYLEATTPGLYYGRPSGDEGAMLLNGGEEGYKEDTYSRQSFRQSLRTKWTKWLGILMLLIFVFAAGFAFTISARKDKQVSTISLLVHTMLTFLGFSCCCSPVLSPSCRSWDITLINFTRPCSPKRVRGDDRCRRSRHSMAITEHGCCHAVCIDVIEADLPN